MSQFPQGQCIRARAELTPSHFRPCERARTQVARAKHKQLVAFNSAKPAAAASWPDAGQACGVCDFCRIFSLLEMITDIHPFTSTNKQPDPDPLSKWQQLTALLKYNRRRGPCSKCVCVCVGGGGGGVGGGGGGHPTHRVSDGKQPFHTGTWGLRNSKRRNEWVGEHVDKQISKVAPPSLPTLCFHCSHAGAINSLVCLDVGVLWPSFLHRVDRCKSLSITSPWEQR